MCHSPCFDYLGFGLGLRAAHYETILSTTPDIDWFEIITEDYLVAGGRAYSYLEKICSHYPIVMHGVSLSIGSSDPIDFDYLSQVKALAHRIQAPWISDHLCWTGIKGKNLHDLLPVPYTTEMLNHIAERVLKVQEFLEQPILLENPSAYATFKQDTMPEWEFLTALVEKTGCRMLLDINNIYVNSFNHGFDPQHYLDNIPIECVQQFHLAGHRNLGTHIVDTHDEDIIPNVWGLYEKAVDRFGKVSVMIERDDNIPPLETLLAELEQAKAIAKAEIS